MFGLFKKKTEKEKLQEQYEKLLKEEMKALLKGSTNGDNGSNTQQSRDCHQ